MNWLLIGYQRVSLLVLLLIVSNIWHVGAQVGTLPQPEAITSKQGLPQAFVPSIIQDRQGFIWMATRDGLCRYDGNHFKVFQPTADDSPGISSSSLFGLSPDQQGRIWIFSDQHAIDIVDPLREKFTNVSRQPLFSRSFEHDLIDAHYIDRKGHLWLSYLSNKVVRMDVATHRFRQFRCQPIPGYFPTFSAFSEDQQGTIWMSNKTGLYRFDASTARFIPYPLPDNDIRGIYLRWTGELLLLTSRSVMLLNTKTNQVRTFPLPVQVDPTLGWHYTRFASDSQGNIYFNQYNILFRFSTEQTITVLTRLDPMTAFRNLFIDQSDVLWGGTDRIGVLKYNLKANRFRVRPYRDDFYRDLFIQHIGVSAQQLPVLPKGVSFYSFRYTIDKAGKLWFNMATNQIYQVDLHTKQVTPVSCPIARPANYTWTYPVIQMVTDPAGRVWAINDSVAMWYEGARWHSLPFPMRSLKNQPKSQSLNGKQVNGINGQILQAVIDKQAIWLITRDHGLYRMSLANGQIRHYSHSPTDIRSLSSDQLFCLFAEPLDENILWIGTFGNGLCRFDKRTGTCRRFTTQSGLPNNVIYCAIPDSQGFLWIGTNQGLCRMDRRSFQTRTYTHEDGILEDEFNRFHFLQLPDGQILLGGLGGITSFYPNALRNDTYQPPIQITDIQINNKPLLIGPLTDSLPAQAIRRLELSNNQNFITVSFAALQFNRQAKIRYRYQLVGLNTQWIETNQPIAQYTDLRWGHYRLRLNASNTSGIWSKHIRELELIIRPPWWATWWAIVLYLLTVMGVAYALLRYYMKHQEAKQLKVIDAMKARFFTNITHEFRTPLTLITGPAQQLKKRLQNTDDQRQIDLINQNATKLLGLINQLMDLSKAEASALQVNESQGDLATFVGQLVHSFDTQAQSKGIVLTFRADQMTSQYWFDAEKLEQIVTNLVANALKFTPVHGKVTVKLSVDKVCKPLKPSVADVDHAAWLHLEVSDNGIGITPDKLPHIFNRFYQAHSGSKVTLEEKHPNATELRGTGIGLALVKELVEIQGGTIQVVSQQGVGTTFMVHLPYRTADSIPLSIQPAPHLVDSTYGSKQSTAPEAPVILLVEDNLSLTDFIVSSLPTYYQIHKATDGIDGVQQAFDLVPDLVISDVLMPRMDGFTFCRRLKEDPRTSHIPIVLLTAKASVDSRLEGLSLGADDYITKPFNIQEFQLRIRNLLDHRRHQRQWILASMTSPDPLPDAPTPIDPLLEKLMQIIEEHLDESSFGAEELTLASGMSRMNLHRKLKALADTSTGEFIRNYRLKRAAQLLRQGHSVSETAYLVGFEDPSYFAKSFRKLYEMTPSAFAHTQ